MKRKTIVMDEAHTFEHDGYTVEFYRDVVGTRLEKRRLQRALIDAYNLNGQDIPYDTWDDFDEFSQAVAQSKTDAPWWIKSLSTPEHIREAFECFKKQDTALLDKLLAASKIVAAPKKTTETTPLIPES